MREAHSPAPRRDWLEIGPVLSSRVPTDDAAQSRSGDRCLNLRQDLIEWLRRYPKIAAKRVAECDNQDQHQRPGNRQRGGHHEVHAEARNAEEGTEGNCETAANQRYYPDNRWNGGLGSQQSFLSCVR